MDRMNMVLRSCGMLMAFVLVLGVSGAFADGIGRDYDHGRGSLIKSEPVGTSWSSTRFADLPLVVGSQRDEIFGRTNGLRYGEWFWFNLKDFRDKDTGGGPSGDPTTATPEPGTFLLLANGLGFLLFSRRRRLNA
jgi:hypothetical protein